MKINLLYQKLFTAVFLINILLVSSCSNYKIYNLKNASSHEIANHGLVYSLPKTVLRVEVTATKTAYKPGPYSLFAAKYLGITNVPKKDSVAWYISDVNINSYPEPDQDHYYFIESNRFGTNDLINLSNNGLIVSFGNNVEMETKKPKTDLFLNQVFSEAIELTKLPVMNAQTEVIDTTYRTVITDSSFLKLPVLRKQQVNKSLEKKAEEIANLILELREEKVALLIGDINEFPDGRALEIIINEFEKIEEQYLPLFTGTRTTREFKTVFEFTPSINNQKSKNILFRFSSKNGILSNTDLRGRPIMVEAINSNNTLKFDNFQLHKDTLVVEDKGIIYRIPDEAMVRIVDNKKVIATRKTNVAQYGKLNILPKRIISKKNIKIDFYPEFGSIKSIKN